MRVCQLFGTLIASLCMDKCFITEEFTVPKKIRYGVVGLGHIAQSAVLPAFVNAKTNSQLTALISEDPKKLKVLGKEYKIDNLYSYDELEECLTSGLIDALYVATPNNIHREIVELAAKHNIHVLCEKPMAVSKEDCTKMDQAARKNKIKLMIAYRLHFEAANLEAVKLCRDGKLGDLRFFNSNFSFQIKDKSNIRLNDPDVGGGPLHDIGLYCINASRYLFQEEPKEVFAMTANSGDIRFDKCDETVSVIMRFSKDRLANFTISFGSFDSSDYEIIGTEGRIRLEHAYDYAEKMKLRQFSENGKEKIKVFKKRDQFSAELLYFSDCILKNKEPEPNAVEGLADIKIIEAIYKSIKFGKPVAINTVVKLMYPNPKMQINRPGVKKRRTYHATGPSND
jgi:predicted dehydrogenase